MRLRSVFVIAVVSLLSKPAAGPPPPPLAASGDGDVGSTTASPSFREAQYVADLDRRIAERERLLLAAAEVAATPSRPSARLAAENVERALLLLRHALLAKGCDAPTRRRGIAARAEACLGLDGRVLAEALELVSSDPSPGDEAVRRLRALAAQLGRARASLTPGAATSGAIGAGRPALAGGAESTPADS